MEIPIPENYKEQAIFGYLILQLRDNKTEFSETGRAYVKLAKGFFDEAIKGLESILHPEKGYVINNATLKIYQAIKGDKEINKAEDIKEAIEEIENSKKRLDKLVNDPEKFYESRDFFMLDWTLRNLWENYL